MYMARLAEEENKEKNRELRVKAGSSMINIQEVEGQRSQSSMLNESSGMQQHSSATKRLNHSKAAYGS